MAESIKIKVKDLNTGKIDVFEVCPEDCMADVLEAMGHNVNEYEVADGLTGRYFDKKTKFGETDKTVFAIAKK